MPWLGYAAPFVTILPTKNEHHNAHRDKHDGGYGFNLFPMHHYVLSLVGHCITINVGAYLSRSKLLTFTHFGCSEDVGKHIYIYTCMRLPTEKQSYKRVSTIVIASVTAEMGEGT